jgi:signal transduction histidine kinase
MASPRSTNIKLALVIAAIILVVATLFYTQILVKKLLTKEHEIADLYAKSLQYIATSPIDQADYSFIFDEVLKTIDFPIILTDNQNNPIPPFYTTTRNVTIDTTKPEQLQENYLRKLIIDFDATNPPIKVSLNDTIVLQYVHFGESKIITELRWLPIIEIILASMFILLGYVGFSYIKRTEQSNIWVGMAKETAHQLGTPLSSVMGWIEMIKLQAESNPKLMETANEMENDLRRLQKVAERFSKIGSKPNLKEEQINQVIEFVISYFKRRLPQLGKNIEIVIENSISPTVKINRELFEWVIENLIKNSLDAIEQGTGKITFSVQEKGKGIFIEVHDTGKGIDPKIKNDIFRPGYSTKERGWGLGLSLSKRIIETYHKGRLILLDSKPGKGTTFRIKLNKG